VDFDADPLSFQLTASEQRGAAAHERIEHCIAHEAEHFDASFLEVQWDKALDDPLAFFFSPQMPKHRSSTAMNSSRVMSDTPVLEFFLPRVLVKHDNDFHWRDHEWSRCGNATSPQAVTAGDVLLVPDDRSSGTSNLRSWRWL